MCEKKQIIITSNIWFTILNMCWPSTMPISPICSIHTLRCFLSRFWLSSLQNNIPSKSFQAHSFDSQNPNNTYVNILPLLFRIQNIETFEYVNDGKKNNKISHWIVVNIPVKSEFMILFRPYKQSEYLDKMQIFLLVKLK